MNIFKLNCCALNSTIDDTLSNVQGKQLSINYTRATGNKNGNLHMSNPITISAVQWINSLNKGCTVYASERESNEFPSFSLLKKMNVNDLLSKISCNWSSNVNKTEYQTVLRVYHIKDSIPVTEICMLGSNPYDIWKYLTRNFFPSFSGPIVLQNTHTYILTSTFDKIMFNRIKLIEFDIATLPENKKLIELYGDNHKSTKIKNQIMSLPKTNLSEHENIRKEYYTKLLKEEKNVRSSLKILLDNLNEESTYSKIDDKFKPKIKRKFNTPNFDNTRQVVEYFNTETTDVWVDTFAKKSTNYYTMFMSMKSYAISLKTLVTDTANEISCERTVLKLETKNILSVGPLVGCYHGKETLVELFLGILTYVIKQAQNNCELANSLLITSRKFIWAKEICKRLEDKGNLSENDFLAYKKTLNSDIRINANFTKSADKVFVSSLLRSAEEYTELLKKQFDKKYFTSKIRIIRERNNSVLGLRIETYTKILKLLQENGVIVRVDDQNALIEAVNEIFNLQHIRKTLNDCYKHIDTEFVNIFGQLGALIEHAKTLQLIISKSTIDRKKIEIPNELIKISIAIQKDLVYGSKDDDNKDWIGLIQLRNETELLYLNLSELTFLDESETNNQKAITLLKKRIQNLRTPESVIEISERTRDPESIRNFYEEKEKSLRSFETRHAALYYVESFNRVIRIKDKRAIVNTLMNTNITKILTNVSSQLYNEEESILYIIGRIKKLNSITQEEYNALTNTLSQEDMSALIFNTLPKPIFDIIPIDLLLTIYTYRLAMLVFDDISEKKMEKQIEQNQVWDANILGEIIEFGGYVKGMSIRTRTMLDANLETEQQATMKLLVKSIIVKKINDTVTNKYIDDWLKNVARNHKVVTTTFGTFTRISSRFLGTSTRVKSRAVKTTYSRSFKVRSKSVMRNIDRKQRVKALQSRLMNKTPFKDTIETFSESKHVNFSDGKKTKLQDIAETKLQDISETAQVGDALEKNEQTLATYYKELKNAKKVKIKLDKELKILEKSTIPFLIARQKITTELKDLQVAYQKVLKANNTKQITADEILKTIKPNDNVDNEILEAALKSVTVQNLTNADIVHNTYKKLLEAKYEKDYTKALQTQKEASKIETQKRRQRKNTTNSARNTREKTRNNDISRLNIYASKIRNLSYTAYIAERYKYFDDIVKIKDTRVKVLGLITQPLIDMIEAREYESFLLFIFRKALAEYETRIKNEDTNPTRMLNGNEMLTVVLNKLNSRYVNIIRLNITPILKRNTKMDMLKSIDIRKLETQETKKKLESYIKTNKNYTWGRENAGNTKSALLLSLKKYVEYDILKLSQELVAVRTASYTMTQNILKKVFDYEEEVKEKYLLLRKMAAETAYNKHRMHLIESANNIYTLTRQNLVQYDNNNNLYTAIQFKNFKIAGEEKKQNDLESIARFLTYAVPFIADCKNKLDIVKKVIEEAETDSSYMGRFFSQTTNTPLPVVTDESTNADAKKVKEQKEREKKLKAYIDEFTNEN